MRPIAAGLLLLFAGCQHSATKAACPKGTTCPPAPVTYTLGGTASGIAGVGLVLATDGGDQLALAADGPFQFPTALADGAAYSVSVATNPSLPDQTCVVANGSGVISGANVTNVTVTCTTTNFTVGGVAFGLAGPVVLQLDAGNQMLTLSGDGAFHFSSALPDGTIYTASIVSAPTAPKQNCALTNALGQIDGGDVHDLIVTCLNDKFTVGGTVVGLGSSGTLVLQDGGTDDLTLTADGAFTFGAGRTPGGTYAVTVKTQPAGQLCTVLNGSGDVGWVNVGSVSVVCMPAVAPQYAIAPNWNDYANAVDTTMACAGTEKSWWGCLHGGERRQVVVPGKTSCTGLSASDDLNAFDWKCAANPVRFVTTNLRDDKRLADLIDWDAVAWLPNRVVVHDGATALPTPTTAWWSNPVVEPTPPANGDNQAQLDAAGTIYAVKTVTDPTCLSRIDYYEIEYVDHIALVVRPGVVLKNPSCERNDMVLLTNAKFIWIEGSFENPGGNGDIAANLTSFLVARDLTSNNSPVSCLQLDNTSSSYVARLRCERSGYGFTGNVSGSLIHDVHISATTSGSGDSLDIGGNDSVFSDMLLDGARGAGITVSGSTLKGNVMTGVTAVANGLGLGISQTQGTTIMNLTLANSGTGLVTSEGAAFTLANVVVENNADQGLDVYGSDVTAYNLAIAYNARQGIYVEQNGTFTAHGRLLVGQNGLKQCGIATGGTGIVDTTCSDSGLDGSTTYGGGASDARFSPTVGTGQYFVSTVSSDAVNAQGGTLPMAFANITDFLGFENPLRAWGIDGPFPATYTRGVCAGVGICNIYDWSLEASDAILRGVNAVSTGNDTLAHHWGFTAANQADCTAAMPGSLFVAANDCKTLYLKNAVEVFDDGIGNDNALCESGETCIFSPNIGSYQGHGDLISAGPFTDGVITGVTLLKYAINGR